MYIFCETDITSYESLIAFLVNMNHFATTINHFMATIFSKHTSAWLRAKHVYGYEVVPEAIADARKNAKLNGINNATFVQGDLNKINESFGKEFPKPDIIISGSYWFIYCYYSLAFKF